MLPSIKTVFCVAIIALIFQSCVPNRKYMELSNEHTVVETQNEELRNNNEQLNASVNETQSEIAQLKERMAGLKSDTSMLGTALRIKTQQYDKINELNDIMSAKNNELLQGAIDENKALLSELDQTRQELLAKEDMLNVLEGDLNMKEASLNELSADLEAKANRVNELEELLQSQQASVKALKDKVSKALLGLEGEGLTIEQKNGKVYVSLEANLLFPSGSTVINNEGKQALIDLAIAIQDQEDLEIVVEGHTDTDKMSSNSIPRDNWELSVLRATSVVKIMTSSSTLDPKILSASGRSEYLPVDPSDKSKNRRIEIILSPNLDELFKIIEG